jgi:predicted dehydrogenase
MFESEVRYFIEDCLLGGREPLSSLRDALRALQIMEAVEQSIEKHSVVEIAGGHG